MTKHDAVILTIELPLSLSVALSRTAAEHNTTAASLAAECIAQSLEVAIRHQVLIDRQQEIDQAILTLADFVGKLSAGQNLDLSKVETDP